MPGPLRAGEFGRHARGEAGQPHRANSGKVADETVGDEGGDAAVPHHAEGEIAGDGGLPEAVGGADDDIAGLGDAERAEHGEIVGGAGGTGDGDAAERFRRSDRLDPPVHGAAPAEGVGDEAGRQAGEGRDFRRSRAGKPASDLEKR